MEPGSQDPTFLRLCTDDGNNDHNVTKDDNEVDNVSNYDTDDDNDDNSYEIDLGGGQEGGQPTNSYDPNTGDYPFLFYRSSHSIDLCKDFI